MDEGYYIIHAMINMLKRLIQFLFPGNLKKTIRSPLFWLILSGYILRIGLMPTTGQHDVMFMPWTTHFINLGNFNIYAYLYEKFGDVVMNRPAVWAPYPYGFYAFTATWLEALQKLGAMSLVTWNSIWEVAHPARQVFLLKLAYLPFDLTIAYVLFRSCGLTGLALWSLSPAAIYTPFMMGQNDIYATAFAVAGVYAATKSLNISSEKRSIFKPFLDRWQILSCLLL
jgi:hypothetical protein